MYDLICTPRLSPLRNPRRPTRRLPVLTRRSLRRSLPRVLLPLALPLRLLAHVLQLLFALRLNTACPFHSTRHPIALGRFSRICELRVRHTNSRNRLLLIGRVKKARNALPPLVRLRSELFHHFLSRDVVLLLLYARCCFACVAEPLVPLCCSFISSMLVLTIEISLTYD